LCADEKSGSLVALFSAPLDADGQKISVMGKLLGLLLGALSIGVTVGVVFQLAYPDTRITSDLGLLFALVGLVLSWLIRAGWQVLRGR
jgi:hypothetical protein